MALSSATVAPFSAARVAAILRQPCADRLGRPAFTQAFLNALPHDSFVKGLPFLPQIKLRSPVGPASSVRCRTGKIGNVTGISPSSASSSSPATGTKARTMLRQSSETTGANWRTTVAPTRCCASAPVRQSPIGGLTTGAAHLPPRTGANRTGAKTTEEEGWLMNLYVSSGRLCVCGRCA